jgi:hypothetical protein
MKIKLNEQQTKQFYELMLPELIRIEKEKNSKEKNDSWKKK